MNINQLQNIIQNLPKKLINSFKESDFQTCWYGSAGLDIKLLEYFIKGTPDSLLNKNVLDNQSVKIFFFTDSGYNFHTIFDIHYEDNYYNFRDGINSIYQYEDLLRTGRCLGTALTFCGHYLSKLVEYKINNTLVYCFYISIDDSQFEQLIIAHDLKIDIGCHAGGWAGDGPTLFNELGLKFYLGNYNGSIQEQHNVNILSAVNWGLCRPNVNSPNSCSFYEIIN
jgi:hypothetical protein